MPETCHADRLNFSASTRFPSTTSTVASSAGVQEFVSWSSAPKTSEKCVIDRGNDHSDLAESARQRKPCRAIKFTVAVAVAAAAAGSYRKMDGRGDDYCRAKDNCQSSDRTTSGAARFGGGLGFSHGDSRTHRDSQLSSREGAAEDRRSGSSGSWQGGGGDPPDDDCESESDLAFYPFRAPQLAVREFQSQMVGFWNSCALSEIAPENSKIVVVDSRLPMCIAIGSLFEYKKSFVSAYSEERSAFLSVIDAFDLTALALHLWFSVNEKRYVQRVNTAILEAYQKRQQTQGATQRTTDASFDIPSVTSLQATSNAKCIDSGGTSSTTLPQALGQCPASPYSREFLMLSGVSHTPVVFSLPESFQLQKFEEPPNVPSCSLLRAKLETKRLERGRQIRVLRALRERQLEQREILRRKREMTDDPGNHSGLEQQSSHSSISGDQNSVYSLDKVTARINRLVRKVELETENEEQELEQLKEELEALMHVEQQSCQGRHHRRLFVDYARKELAADKELRRSNSDAARLLVSSREDLSALSRADAAKDGLPASLSLLPPGWTYTVDMWKRISGARPNSFPKVDGRKTPLEALILLLQSRTPHVAVWNEKRDCPLNFVSNYNLLNRLLQHLRGRYPLLDMRVRGQLGIGVPSHQVVGLSINTPLREYLQLIRNMRISCIPIVDEDGSLINFFTKSHFLSIFAKEFHEMQRLDLNLSVKDACFKYLGSDLSVPVPMHSYEAARRSQTMAVPQALAAPALAPRLGHRGQPFMHSGSFGLSLPLGHPMGPYGNVLANELQLRSGALNRRRRPLEQEGTSDRSSIPPGSENQGNSVPVCGNARRSSADDGQNQNLTRGGGTTRDTGAAAGAVDAGTAFGANLEHGNSESHDKGYYSPYETPQAPSAPQHTTPAQPHHIMSGVSNMLRQGILPQMRSQLYRHGAPAIPPHLAHGGAAALAQFHQNQYQSNAPSTSNTSNATTNNPAPATIGGITPLAWLLASHGIPTAMAPPAVLNAVVYSPAVSDFDMTLGDAIAHVLMTEEHRIVFVDPEKREIRGLVSAADICAFLIGYLCPICAEAESAGE